MSLVPRSRRRGSEVLAQRPADISGAALQLGQVRGDSACRYALAGNMMRLSRPEGLTHEHHAIILN